MRFTKLMNCRLVSSTPHGLAFAGERGESLQVHVLADDLIRVTMFPDGQPRLKRTWAIVGKNGEMPHRGTPAAMTSRPFHGRRLKKWMAITL